MIDMLIQRYDRQLLIYLGVLAVMGTVMLYSASWYESFASSNGRTDMLYLQGHLKRMLVGVFFLFGFLILDYRRLKEIAPYLVIGAIILLIATKAYYLAKGFGWYKPARWLFVGPFTLQTSDFARMAIIVFMAYYIDKKRDQLKDFQMGLLPALSVLAVTMGLIVIQPDYSTALMIGAIGVLILFIGGAKISQLSLAGAGALLVGIPVLLSREYRRQRIFSFFGIGDNPEVGYQAGQSLISLGNGGIFGVGLGNSIEKNHFLPTPHTDFIFAIIGEELGFIGILVLFFLFWFLFTRGLAVVQEAPDLFSMFLSFGIIISVMIYFLVNAAYVVGFAPTTGLPMPFISYGGSHTIFTLMSMGILLNIARRGRVGSNTYYRGYSYDY